MPQTIATDELVYDESPVELPRGLVWVRSQTARVLLQAAQRAAGVSVEYPTDTRTVFALLKIIGYSADRAALDYCLARQYLESPPKESNQFRWRESDVVAFADALESMRRWLPLHSCHVHKLNANERTAHHMEAAKRKAAMEAFVSMNLNDVLNLLAECEDRTTRDMLICALKIKTGLLHVRGDQDVPDHTRRSCVSDADADRRIHSRMLGDRRGPPIDERGSPGAAQ